MKTSEGRDIGAILGELAVVFDDLVGLAHQGDFLIGEAHRLLARPALALVEHSPTVLVVDDDPTLLRSIARALKKSYEVETACSVQEAIETLRTLRLTAIVCDFHLGDGTGIDVLRVAMREQPKALRVLHTGAPSNVKPGHIVQFVVEKPTNVGGLLALLEANLGSAKEP